MANQVNGLQQFCTNVRQLFSDGNPNHESIRNLMSSSSFARNDWQQYAHFDPTVNYTRSVVDDGGEDGHYNLLLLCWNPGSSCCIHDHGESSCFVKVLDGKLQETKYEVPQGGQLTVKDSAVHGSDALTYIDNTIGLHEVRNPSDTEVAVCLNLYYPPLTMCLEYDEAGNSTLCDVKSYY